MSIIDYAVDYHVLKGDTSPMVQTHAKPDQLPTVPPPPGTEIELYDPGRYAGAGTESLDASDRLTPFLAIVHFQCPQIIQASEMYIPNAKPGMIFDTSRREAWPEVEYLPVFVQHTYGLWAPRAQDGSSGGFRGTMDPTDPLIARLLREHGGFKPLPMERDGEHVDAIEQRNLYVLYGPAPITEENARPAIVAATKTRIKSYREWIGAYSDIRYKIGERLVKPALWQHRCRLGTKAVAKGQSMHWFVYTFGAAAIGPDGHPSYRNSIVSPRSDLFAMAGEFYEQIKAGVAQADYAGMEGQVREPGDDGDETVPF